MLINQFRTRRKRKIKHRCLILTLWSVTSHCSYCCLSALPAFFKEGLKNREATDGATATLHCELSKVGVPVEWKKGDKTLKPSDKYRMRQEETSAELLIRDLEVEDTGEYTCVCGDQKTSAVLTVHGKKQTNKTFSSVIAAFQRSPLSLVDLFLTRVDVFILQPFLGLLAAFISSCLPLFVSLTLMALWQHRVVRVSYPRPFYMLLV